ncbi:MAG: single-stranded-DNA-specific exonuclease RecJ [Sphingobacteriales bacterium]|nr:MAG: single-stranded-DNA-specific exonuclease RecJ [Sphingobacteriales bacterium]
MIKSWVQAVEANPKNVNLLAQSLGINPILAAMLVQRGVTTFDEANAFFNPDIAQLHPPFLMKDMDKAIARIQKAIEKQQHILVYGDYDVDGTTSVALVYSFFKEIYPHISYYIPNRYTEGYGISTQGIDYANQNNISLIIALDCGIKSVDKIDYANSLNIDFIICDHHLPSPTLPDAIAVLDPKRPDCTYPYKELSGCGIGFKLIEAFADKSGLPFASVQQYLDLVVVSIASDIVPITGENRILAHWGLKKLNQNPCKGLKALIAISGRGDVFTITDIVFSLGPRINAAGRIDDAKNAVKLLIAHNHENAEDAGFIINTKNTERKAHDADITQQALFMIDNSPELINRKTTVVYHPNWHKGVIGIVASRLTEKYYRPTIVLTQSNGVLAGSARSVKDFDLYAALESCSHLLEQFGGHQYAAGLTLKEENLAVFTQQFENVVAHTITKEQLTQKINIQSPLNLNEIDGKFYRILQRFEPFGPQNMAPVFISTNVKLYGQALIVGNNHLKINVNQHNSAIFSCIGFNLAHYAEAINTGINFDICYTIESNVWKNKISIQLNIKAIRTY